MNNLYAILIVVIFLFLLTLCSVEAFNYEWNL